MKSRFPKIFGLLALCVTFSLCMNSCGSIVKNQSSKHSTVEKGAIPADFGKDGTVLICVLKGRNSRDKYMKKHVDKYYKGPYEYVLESEVDSEKYADTNVYRYLFDYTGRTISGSRFDSRSGEFKNSNAPTSSYYIKDRKTDSIYSSKLNSGYFSKLIEGYVINLEAVRVENQ